MVARIVATARLLALAFLLILDLDQMPAPVARQALVEVPVSVQAEVLAVAQAVAQV